MIANLLPENALIFFISYLICLQNIRNAFRKELVRIAQNISDIVGTS